MTVTKKEYFMFKQFVEEYLISLSFYTVTLDRDTAFKISSKIRHEFDCNDCALYKECRICKENKTTQFARVCDYFVCAKFYEKSISMHSLFDYDKHSYHIEMAREMLRRFDSCC
jgi:hypothetical protein